jgi:nicotinamidase-related amidase
VKWSVLEAQKHGFAITVLIDASLGVNLLPHDSEKAIGEMVGVGAVLATIERLRI